MDINLFNNLQLNGAELKSVQKELSFEFSVQDFVIRAVEDNGAAKVVHVMHQGQTYTDPAYLTNWQTWTDHVFNTIKPVIEAQEKPAAPVLPSAPVAEPVQPVKPLIEFEDDDEEDDEPRKKSKKKQPAPKSKLPLIIIIVVTVLAIVAAGVWWFVLRDTEEAMPEPDLGLEIDMPALPPMEDFPVDDPWDAEVSEYDSALETARNFVGNVPMSRANIIEQLVWGGFSDESIEWAMEQLEWEMDWYGQALWQANEFMNSWDWTEEELRDNLVASGFTESQVEHAMSHMEFE